MAYRVLIVDDSPAMRVFIRRVMELSGLDVGSYLEASNGEEGLVLLSQNWVDVILTDINMPKMNGAEFVRRIESDEMLRDVPVIVVSTDGTAARIHQMLKLGARGYVRKPFLPETLREEIERVLRASHAN